MTERLRRALDEIHTLALESPGGIDPHVDPDDESPEDMGVWLLSMIARLSAVPRSDTAAAAEANDRRVREEVLEQMRSVARTHAFDPLPEDASWEAEVCRIMGALAREVRAETLREGDL